VYVINNRLPEPFVTTSGVRQSCVLAPALFCIAIDWIMSRCAGTMGITVGETTLTDQDYADDAVLFTDDPSNWTQNPGALRCRCSDDGSAYAVVQDSSPKRWLWIDTTCCSHPRAYRRFTDRFTFLGSDISSCGRSTLEMFRRIGHASSVMGQLTSVWRQSRLSLRTKLRLYTALVVSVLLYGAETWTLTKSDKQKLESFQMTFLRLILGIRWLYFAPNVSVMNQTQEQSIHNRIQDRRISVLGYVCRLQESVPAQEALRLVVNFRAGYRPDDRPAWKGPRGRP